jgi:hypothetical protein
MPTEQATSAPPVLRLVDSNKAEVAGLLARFGLSLVCCVDHHIIPGSYWGDDEAGLKGNSLYARGDTPLHSILHEACHYICVSDERRQRLDTNAGSDEAEENAVCYLQVLLAEQLADLGRARIFTDMDAWGYSFRLGSSQRWFESDAEDALAWLIEQQLVDAQANLRWRLRD